MFIESTIEQLERIVAIELLCAARRSLLDAEPELSPPLETAATTLETTIGVLRGDEPLTDRIRRTANLIRMGTPRRRRGCGYQPSLS